MPDGHCDVFDVFQETDLGENEELVQTREVSSFRDPAGQVFIKGGAYHRKISPSYMPEYHRLMASGLYGTLSESGLLLPHEEVEVKAGWLTILPEQVEFISYPYEWCFSMLKEAALNTLEINRIALIHEMMLKDASAFNMQWHNGKMTLIDTLSFAKYDGSQPWVAYRQFIEHFLIPLLVMKYRAASLSKLAEIFIDGIPVSLATKLLPMRTKLNPSLLAHLYAQSISLDGAKLPKEIKMPRRNLDALLDNLRRLVEGLKYKPKSDWSSRYGYDVRSYSDRAFESKRDIVRGMLDYLTFRHLPGADARVCDIGANIGRFSNYASERYFTLAIDNDHDCIERMRDIDWGRLGLVVDICNPTPAVGWGNTERKSFLDRLNVDTIMALAIIHHICIRNNTPVGMVAELFRENCKNLIIEFVPPEDPKAKLLVGNKVFPPYSRDIFEAEFGRYFKTVEKRQVADSMRSIYLMQRR